MAAVSALEHVPFLLWKALATDTQRIYTLQESDTAEAIQSLPLAKIWFALERIYFADAKQIMAWLLQAPP